MAEKKAGGRVQVVRKRLADGTVREYHYDPEARKRRKYEAVQKDAIKRLADDYYQSPEFEALSEPWRKATRYYANILMDHLGWMTFADLGDRKAREEFYEIRDTYAATPAKADKLMNVLRSLLAFGYERVKIDYNHAIGIPRLTPSNRTRAEQVWTPDMRQAFLASAKPWLQRVFMFGLYSAARQADLCRLKWGMMEDGWLSFMPSKTAKATSVRVFLPVFALQPFADLVASLPRHDHGFMLATDDGVPLTTNNIRREVRLTKARAGLTEADITFHDLRGSAETEMLEASCTEAEASSILGHALVHGAGQKSYAARTRRLALHAYQKWNAAMTSDGEIIPLKTGR